MPNPSIFNDGLHFFVTGAIFNRALNAIARPIDFQRRIAFFWRPHYPQSSIKRARQTHQFATTDLRLRRRKTLTEASTQSYKPRRKTSSHDVGTCRKMRFLPEDKTQEAATSRRCHAQLVRISCASNGGSGWPLGSQTHSCHSFPCCCSLS